MWLGVCRTVHLQYHAHYSWGLLGLPRCLVLPGLQQEGSCGIQEGSYDLGGPSPQCHTPSFQVPTRSSECRLLCIHWGQRRTFQNVSSACRHRRRRWAHGRCAGNQDERKLWRRRVRKQFLNGLWTLPWARATSRGVNGPHPQRFRDARSCGPFPIAPTRWHVVSFCFTVAFLWALGQCG